MTSTPPPTPTPATVPPPKPPSDLQSKLNRLRKNYAQEPLYTWLFSVSGTSPLLRPFPTHLTHSTNPHPQILPSLSWHPRPMEYSCLCSANRIRRVFISLSLPFPFLLSACGVVADVCVYCRYGTALGDTLNGAGITASWSLAYFLINSRRSWRFRGFHPLSFAVVNLAGFNALVYGSYYFLDADTARRTDI